MECSAISHVTFPAFYLSIVSCMRLLFQLQGQYCFLLTTKQQIIVHMKTDRACFHMHYSLVVSFVYKRKKNANV